MFLQFLLILSSLLSQGTHTYRTNSHLLGKGVFPPYLTPEPPELPFLPPCSYRRAHPASPSHTLAPESLSSSLAQILIPAPLASHWPMLCGDQSRLCERWETRNKIWRSQHQVQAVMISALQGQPWNYCISCGSSVTLAEKWVPAAYLLNSSL